MTRGLLAVTAVAALAAGCGGGATTTQTVETTTTKVEVVKPTGQAETGFDAGAIYNRESPGVVTVISTGLQEGSARNAAGLGSGFVVSGDGQIATNAHVVTSGAGPDIHKARQVYVRFADGNQVPAQVKGFDPFADVALLKVDPAGLTLRPLPLGTTHNLQVGAPVAAIGSPFGQQTSLSVGVVSATGRSIDSLTSGFAVANAIQVDAPINRGSSGGPLFDAAGRVIGINAQIESTSGTAEGVGFAIPINVARRSLDQLVRTGRVRYAYIGIRTQDVTPGIARRFELGATRGALVTRVDDSTPAARAGLRGGTRTEVYNGLDVTLGGDLIVAIGDSPVTSTDDVSRIVSTELLPGQTVTFTVLRGGTRRATVDVKLGERPAGR